MSFTKKTINLIIDNKIWLSLNINYVCNCLCPRGTDSNEWEILQYAADNVSCLKNVPTTFIGNELSDVEDSTNRGRDNDVKGILAFIGYKFYTIF